MTNWRSGKRRRYSPEFKRQVVAEAAVPGVSVSSVARRHGLNANLIFNWRRWFGATDLSTFIPAVILPDAPSDVAVANGTHDGSGGRMELVCRDGRRIILGPDFDAAALGRLLTVVAGQ